MFPSLSMCCNPNTQGDGVRNQEGRTSEKLLDYMDGPPHDKNKPLQEPRNPDLCEGPDKGTICTPEKEPITS